MLVLGWWRRTTGPLCVVTISSFTDTLLRSLFIDNSSPKSGVVCKAEHSLVNTTICAKVVGVPHVCVNVDSHCTA